MAYTINKTDGSLYATIADGTLDSGTSLTFVGRNYTSFGEIQNENYLRLLENHANTTAPASPLDGQLWFDQSTSILKVYTGVEFKPLGATKAEATEPTTSQEGDVWYDTTLKQLKVFDGTNYTLVGPAYTDADGESGAFVETLTDGGTDYVVTTIKEAGVIISIISNNVQFTPVPAITNFGDVYPGITVKAGTQFVGDATNALSLNGSVAADFLSSTANDSTTGTLDVLNDTGLTVGVNSEAVINVAAGEVAITNTDATGDMVFAVNAGTVITLDGPTARARVAQPLNGLDIANQDYVDSALTNDILAANIPLVDVGTYYTTDEVESALQEVGSALATKSSRVLFDEPESLISGSTVAGWTQVDMSALGTSAQATVAAGATSLILKLHIVVTDSVSGGGTGNCYMYLQKRGQGLATTGSQARYCGVTEEYAVDNKSSVSYVMAEVNVDASGDFDYAITTGNAVTFTYGIYLAGYNV